MGNREQLLWHQSERKKDRLAEREKETESNGRGKNLCASFVLKSIPERSERCGPWARHAETE